MQKFNIIIGVIKLRLDGITYDVVQSRFNVGASTVDKIMKRYVELNISYKELMKMSPSEVEELFYPKAAARRKDIPLPDYQKCYDRITASGSKVNIPFLWYEYKEANPDGYQLTQFYEHYNRFVKENYGSTKARMAVERVPGEKMYIDWVGDQPEILIDQKTGELKKIHVFVTTLGFSSKVYVEVFERETLNNFLKGITDAMRFYDGVPRYLVPDNLPSAVGKHTNDELVLRTAFDDLESFYDTIVLPPPYRKPRGKAAVENHVRTVETHVLEKLKEKTYYTFDAINEDVRKIVEVLNARKKKDEKVSRNELFDKYDKPNMKPLSPGMFTTCEYKYFSKVPDNYHLAFDDHYYSVSYRNLGKPAILKATFDSIMICDENNRLLFTHKRVYNTFPKYITVDEHMPENHRFFKEVNTRDGRYYRNWAERLGPNMFKFIDTVLKTPKHEETAYNSCQGILSMCKDVPAGIYEEAAGRCISARVCRYDAFKRLLKSLRENPENHEPEDSQPELPFHENIRGKEVYR